MLFLNSLEICSPEIKNSSSSLFRERSSVRCWLIYSKTSSMISIFLWRDWCIWSLWMQVRKNSTRKAVNRLFSYSSVPSSMPSSFSVSNFIAKFERSRAGFISPFITAAPYGANRKLAARSQVGSERAVNDFSGTLMQSSRQGVFGRAERILWGWPGFRKMMSEGRQNCWLFPDSWQEPRRTKMMW